MSTTLRPINDDPLLILLFYFGVILGYSATIFLALSRRRIFGPRVQRRTLFDMWLLTFPLAALLTGLFLGLGWPLRLQGWDAHGWGASGYEANALFLPWLHLGLWVILSKAYPILMKGEA